MKTVNRNSPKEKIALQNPTWDVFSFWQEIIAKQSVHFFQPPEHNFMVISLLMKIQPIPESIKYIKHLFITFCLVSVPIK